MKLLSNVICHSTNRISASNDIVMILNTLDGWKIKKSRYLKMFIKQTNI